MMRGFARSTLATVAWLLTMGATCGDADDPYDLTDGDVTPDTATYTGIDYELTSDNYKKWLLANAALDSAGVRPAAELDARSATEDDIDRVVAALSDDPRASAVIASADIGVRDYVMTSVALAQSWDAVDRPGSVTGIPASNVAFLHTQPEARSSEATRPHARFIRHGNRGNGRGRGADKPRWRERGSDSDEDSEKGKKDREKRKGRGKGH